MRIIGTWGSLASELAHPDIVRDVHEVGVVRIPGKPARRALLRVVRLAGEPMVYDFGLLLLSEGRPTWPRGPVPGAVRELQAVQRRIPEIPDRERPMGDLPGVGQFVDERLAAHRVA